MRGMHRVVLAMTSATTLAACGKHQPSLPDGARVVVTLEAKVSESGTAATGALRDTLKRAWSDRFRGARDAGTLALASANVTTPADAPDTMRLEAELRIAGNTCTQEQASALAERVRDLATTSVAFGFYRTNAEAAEALATSLREAPGVTSVSTPYDFPGAILVTPDELGPDSARKLAPPATRVLVERAVGPGSRPRLWVAAPSPDIGSGAVVSAAAKENDNGQYQIRVQLSDEGAKAFADLTGNLIGKPLLIVLDDVVLSAPRIETRIAGGSALVTMGGSLGERGQAEAEALASKLRLGSLPTVPTITKLAAHCAP